MHPKKEPEIQLPPGLQLPPNLANLPPGITLPPNLVLPPGTTLPQTTPTKEKIRKPDQNYDGRRFRKAISRRWCDHRHAFELYTQQRPFPQFDLFPQNIADEYRNLLPCFCYETCGTNFNTRFIAHKNNKFRAATHALAWQPDSMRVVTGDDSGNITMYNGLAFFYEFHLEASRSTLHDIIWTHSGDFLLTINREPSVRIWQANYNQIKTMPIVTNPEGKKCHQITISPNDRKFAICSEDRTVKIWDIATLSEEIVYKFHSEEVRTCDWHPSLSLVASGGKDQDLHFFDPRQDNCIKKLRIHQGAVTRCHWNPNGNYIASCGRDSMVYVTDIRTMSAIAEFKGHENDVFAVQWHPTREDLLVSAGYKGDIMWWVLGVNKPIYAFNKGHNKAIFQLKFNPMGSILASTGTEGVVKFWVRNSCGTDISKSFYEVNKKREVATEEIKVDDIPGLTPFRSLHGLPEEEAMPEEHPHDDMYPHGVEEGSEEESDESI